MSYCEIIGFKNGIPADSEQFRNAWGGAALVWTTLYDKYLKKGEYDSWLLNADPLWKLPKRRNLPAFERAVIVGTFDQAIVRSEHFEQFVKDLRQFAAAYVPDGKVCHLLTWANWIEKHGNDFEAIGFYATSVSENLWYSYDEEKDENIPYDLNQGDKHVEVYEWLESVDADTVES